MSKPEIINNGFGQYILKEKYDEVQKELERERIRLAACGVVALSNTPESAEKARQMNDEYRSASCEYVMRAVDKQMELQRERDELAAIVDAYIAHFDDIEVKQEADFSTMDWFCDVIVRIDAINARAKAARGAR